MHRVQLILFIIFSLELSGTLQAQIYFDHLGLQEGLSQTSVTRIVQDEHGYIFFSTQDGLNRFDGNQIITFRNTEFPLLSDNYVMSMAYQELDHQLWFGTVDGNLFTLNTAKGNLEQIDLSSLGIISNGYIKFILADENGIWLVRYNDGFYYHDIQTKKTIKIKESEKGELQFGITLFRDSLNHAIWAGTESGLSKIDMVSKKSVLFINKKKQIELGDTFVNALTIDKQSVLWLGTGNGLKLFDIQTNRFISLPDNDLFRMNITITSLLNDHNNQIWVGTRSQGLFTYQPKTKELNHYKKSVTDKTSLSSNYVNIIYEDKNDQVWLATYGFGISRADNRAKKIEHYFSGQNNNDKTLTNNMVRTFYEVSDGEIWVGTGGGGVNIFNLKNRSFENLPQSLKNLTETGQTVWSITGNSKQNVYLGTGEGIFNYHLKTQKLHHYQSTAKLAPAFSTHLINDSLLFIGTIGKGFYLLNTQNGRIESFDNLDNEHTILNNNFIISVASNHPDSIWVGTFGAGLFLLKTKDKSFTPLKEVIEGVELTDTKITTIKLEPESILWVGTSNGLNKIDLKSKTVEYFQLKDGLPNSYIYSIEKDRAGFHWISTNRGITRIDPEKMGVERILNLTPNDGLQSFEFNTGASFQTNDGLLLFGGVNGFNVINPEDLKISHQDPPIVLSSYSVNNNFIDYFIEKNNHHLTLTPSDLTLSLTIATLNYSNSGTNQYAYLLKNFDQKWIYIQNRQFIQFTSLPPGNYELYLKGTNADGMWGNPHLALSITVLPPFWGTLWFRVFAILFLASGVFSYIWIVQKRKQKLENLIQEKAEELTKNEQLYRMIAENVTDTILVIRNDLKLDYVSPSLINLLGYEQDFLNEKSFYKLVHPDDQPYITEASKTMFQDAINHYEFRMMHKDGRYIIISATTQLTNFGNSNDVKVIGVFRDISAIRTYEDALIKSRQEAIEANKAKSMFLAGMSHELRTPLNAILGFAQILQMDEEIPRRKRAFIQTMYKSGNHLLQMINDVLDFSKIEAGKQDVHLKVFDLMSMAYELESMFSLECHQKKLFFDFDFDKTAPRYIVSDASKLQQILINIIGNAIKFTEKGTIIFQIKASGFEQDQTCRVHFIISDTGVGISKEQQKAIFDPFQQVEQKVKQGTGLGLSISKKLIELMHGTMTLRSDLGSGSQFEVTLPVRYEMVMNLDEDDDQEKWNYEGLSILVVDDIETNREMAKEMLEHYNMSVQVAQNGRECLDLIANQKFDLVLMDYLMPDLNGLQSLELLRKVKDYENTPVIALTAYGLNKDGDDFIEMGFDGFLSKPISKKELLTKIAQSVSLRSKRKINAEQVLMDMDIQQVAYSILQLPEDRRGKWIDALEMLDLDVLKSLSENETEMSVEISAHIKKELEQLDYRFFISLSELLS